MPLREYAGGAKRTALVGDITATSTNLTVSDATGYPTGATAPFVIAIDTGVAAEEKVLIASRSGNTLTVAAGGRGFDGTTAAAHGAGSVVDHVLTATDIREANTHVNDATVHGGISAADADAAYLAKAQNLADLPDKVAARTNLAVQSTTEANAAYASKPGFSALSATVGGEEATTSGTFTDLATIGPDVSFTAPPSGRVLLSIYAGLYSPQGTGSWASFELTNTTTATVVQAASTAQMLAAATTNGNNGSAMFLLTVTAGQAYRVRFKGASATAGNSARFVNRTLTVVPVLV